MIYNDNDSPDSTKHASFSLGTLDTRACPIGSLVVLSIRTRDVGNSSEDDSKVCILNNKW